MIVWTENSAHSFHGLMTIQTWSNEGSIVPQFTVSNNSILCESIKPASHGLNASSTNTHLESALIGFFYVCCHFR